MRNISLAVFIMSSFACAKFEAKPLLTDEAIVPSATVLEFEASELQNPSENEMMGDDGEKRKAKFVKLSKVLASPQLDADSIVELQKEVDSGKYYVALEDIQDLIPKDPSGLVQIQTSKEILLYQDVGQPEEPVDLDEPEATPDEKLKHDPSPVTIHPKEPAPVHIPTLSSEATDFAKLGVPKDAATKAFEFFKTSPPQIKNKNNIVIADFTAPSFRKRLYLLDLPAKTVDRYYVSHGSGKAKRKNPAEFCKFFGNEENSLLTPPGFLVTAESFIPRVTKQSSWGKVAMLLDGLERRNSNTRRRQVVMHGSRYTTDDWVKKNGAPGQSSGCPSVPRNFAPAIIDRVKGGTLWYHYVG